MNLLDRIRRRSLGLSDFGLPPGYDAWSQLLLQNTRTIDGRWEVTSEDLDSVASKVYKASGPIFALIAVRMLLFSEARFAYQQMRNNRPGELFGTPALSILENPWPNATTGTLLSRCELDVSLLGNSFTYRDPRRDQLKRLRPDWVTVLYGSDSAPELAGDAIDGELLGYFYTPRIAGATGAALSGFIPAEDVAHYAPYPDPQMYGRGMSWMTPILSEVEADDHAVTHKGSFFRNGAVSKLAMKVDPSVDLESFKALVAEMDKAHSGPWNAYKTLYVGGGADPVPMSFNLKDLDYHAIQGGGETRMAAAAGVPPTIVGFSEGLEGSALNAGNYQQTKRRLGDGTLRPLWREVAGAFASIMPVEDNARLWYDDRDIAFLRDDKADTVKITQTQAGTVRQLIDAGFEPDAAIAAVLAEDISALKGKHTGLFSVQLQPPSDGTNPAGDIPSLDSTEPPADPALEPGNKTDTTPAAPADGGAST